MSKRRVFTVKTLNFDDPDFQCTGIMGDTNLLITDVVESESIAAAKLVRSEMEERAECMFRVDLSVVLPNSPTREQTKFVVESISTWAEKSRVKNFRGFRANAVRTHRTEGPVIETTVLLGEQIYYNENQVRSFAVQSVFDKDFALFQKLVEREIPGAVLTANVEVVRFKS